MKIRKKKKKKEIEESQDGMIQPMTKIHNTMTCMKPFIERSEGKRTDLRTFGNQS